MFIDKSPYRHAGAFLGLFADFRGRSLFGPEADLWREIEYQSADGQMPVSQNS